MTKPTCDCLSYNQPRATQSRPSVVLFPPFMDRSVCIDACIADAMQVLWAAGIVTRGSCCGHGDGPPSVVLEDGASDELAQLARDLLNERDGRPWDVLAWRLTSVPPAPASLAGRIAPDERQ